MSDDRGILERIEQLTDEEHHLFERHKSGSSMSSGERERLRSLETELDRCWDLLRQRRARREFGQDTADVEARDASVVEGYRQ